MKDRSRLYKTFLVLCAALGIVLSGFMQQRLDRARGDLGLTRLAPLENAPPVLAFTTVALGGFRGLIANALWVRAVELQDAGKYFEMVQLADWITKLQPHIPTVWIAQAWNMSYNISIKFQNPADRWLWVERGITLLRDQALKYNPQESNLYRELAWHFQHKIGANLDDAHKYYKQLWIEKMSEVLGGGRPNWAELTNPTTPEAAARLKTLREVYKMDPAIMKEADDAYGPLDWRMPETQAIYWAWIGLSKSKNEELIKLRRVIYQSMQLAFQRGRLVESRMGNIAFAPNLDIIPHVSKAYEDMMVQDPEQAKQIRTGHKNFLRDAVYFLYCHNRVAEANRWYAYLGEKYPTDALWDKPGATPLNTTMENYALDRLEEDVGDTSVDRHEKLPVVPRYPQVRLDFSFMVDAAQRYAQIEQDIGGFKHILLKRLSFVGSFEGSSVPDGKRSLTLRAEIGSDDRTLSEEEIRGFQADFRGFLSSHQMELRG